MAVALHAAVPAAWIPLCHGGATALARAARHVVPALALIGLTAALPLRADTVYSQGFESGAFGAEWTLTGTNQKRTQITTANVPHGGTRHLTMDDTAAGGYSRNEATLTLDLADWRNVVLTFWAKEFGDEVHTTTSPFASGANFDGVAISADGTTWYVVLTFPSSFSTYQQFTIDLDAAIAAAGLAYTGTFKVRFNQYDDYPIATDGIAIDDVLITAVAADDLEVAPEAGLTSAGYEGGPFAPASATYTLSNTGSGVLHWRVQPPAAAWVSVSPAQGTLAPGITDQVEVALNSATASLTWNATPYACPVVFENVSTGVTFTRNVQLTVNVPPPQASLAPESLLFFCPPGQTGAQTLTLRNLAPAGSAGLTFTAKAVSSGAPPATDTVGGTTYGTSYANRYCGNVYQPNRPTMLQTIESCVSFTGPRTLEFAVFESATASGTYTRILSQTVNRTGTGATFYASDPVNLRLESGKYYYIATGWSTSQTYYYNSTSHPLTVGFGQAQGGFVYSGYPLNGTVSVTPGSYNYYQRLTTSRAWLGVTPPSGAVTPGAQTSLQATADSATLSAGLYSGQLDVATNDPELPALTVPTRLAVGDVVVVTLPERVKEGDGTLPAAAMVNIPVARAQDLTVTLDSDTPDELDVPASVVIPAGQTFASFDLVVLDDTESDGAQTVTVTAVATGYTGSSATTDVRDNDVARFAFDTVPEEQYLQHPFQVSIAAQDPDGEPAIGFTGSVQLAGKIVDTRTQLSTIAITEVDPNTPDVVEFTNVSSAAVDIGGWQVVIYDATAWPTPTTVTTLPAGTLCPAGAVFRIQEYGASPGAWPLFYTGANINWTNSTATAAVLLLDAQSEIADFFTSGSPATIAFPCSIPTAQWSGNPVAVLSDSTVTWQRTGSEDHNDNSDWTAAAPNGGTLNPGLSLPFPAELPPIPVSPLTTGAFVNGVWTGQVTVTQRAWPMQLLVDDGSGHTGESTEFNVIARFSVNTATGNDANTGLDDAAPKRTIQAAIAAAQTHDLVVVAPGTYHERLDFLGKTIAVTGTDPTDPDTVAATVIDADATGTVVTFANGESKDSRLTGFTITNASTGGISITGASPTLSHCRIVGNQGRGITITDAPTLTIDACVIDQNAMTGGRGGGLFASASSVVLTNCQVSRNQASVSGGGLYINGTGVLTNCTLVANTAAGEGGGLWLSPGGGSKVTNCIAWSNSASLYPQIGAAPTTPVTYSCVQGGYTGTGNISSDPLFVAAATGDYHLLAGSPCIDTGTAPGAPATDIDDEPRPYPLETGAIDMGADEYLEYVTLTVIDSLGSATPPAGEHTYIRGATVSATAGGPSAVADGERDAATGWTGAGSVPATGTAAATGPIVLDTDSTLTWTWTRQYWLEVQPCADGTVDTPSGWHNAGAAVTLTATPGSGHEFKKWRGNVTLGREYDNPVTLSMYRPRTLYAEFVETGRGASDADKVTYTLFLEQGWNLISIPIQPENTALSVVLQGVPLVGPVYTYDPVSRQYVQVTTIRPGTGYWIQCSAACVATIHGYRVETSEVEVLAGWNFLATASDTDRPDDPMVVGTVWYWSGTGFSPATAIEMGLAYWVYISPPNGALGGLLVMGDPAAPTNAQLAGYRDTDGDGMADLHEFRLGFRRRTANSHARLPHACDFRNRPVTASSGPSQPPSPVSALTRPTYAAGAVDGQGGWIGVADPGATAPAIETETLRVNPNSTAIFPVAAFDEARVWVSLRAQFSAAADLDSNPPAPDNLENLMFALSSDRSIPPGLYALAWNADDQDWQWQMLDATVQPGQWFDLTVAYDYSRCTADVYLNGALAAQELAFAAESYGFAGFCHDGAFLPSSGYLLIDDLQVRFDAPAALRNTGAFATAPIHLDQGWNLVSFPVSVAQSPAAIFAGLVAGPAWYWNTRDQSYQPALDTIKGVGYWVECTASSGATVRVTGNLGAERTRDLEPGWTLFGPQTDMPAPANPAAWRWTGSAYQTPVITLDWGAGYWTYTATATSLPLLDTDRDADGLPDAWELGASGGFDNLLQNQYDDSDGDGLANADEYYAGTGANDGDWDDDGLSDGHEIALGYDPLANADAGQAWAAAPTLYATGFESPPTETYATGNLDGQNGWRVCTGAAAVVTSPVYSGTQAVRLGNGSTTSENVIEKRFTDPAQDLQEKGVFWLDVAFRPAAFASLTTPASSRADLCVGVNATGQLCLWHGGAVEGWTDTGVYLTLGQWYRISALLNFNTRTIGLYLNGAALPPVAMRDVTPDTMVRVGLGIVTATFAYLDDVRVSTVPPAAVDADADTLADVWELTYFGNLAQTATADPDNDGLDNAAEFRAGAAPNDNDTDNDGMPDGWELTHGLNPLGNDAPGDLDADGLTNLGEYQHSQDPAAPDSDHDGVPDGYEVEHSWDLASTVYQLETWAATTTDWAATGNTWAGLSGQHNGRFEVSFDQDWLPNPYGALARTTSAKFLANYTAALNDVLAFDLGPGNRLGDFTPLSVRLRFHSTLNDSTWISDELLTDESWVDADTCKLFAKFIPAQWHSTRPGTTGDIIANFNAADWLEVGLVRASTDETDFFTVDNFRVMSQAAGAELAAYLHDLYETGRGGTTASWPTLDSYSFDFSYADAVVIVDQGWCDPEAPAKRNVSGTVIPKCPMRNLAYRWSYGNSVAGAPAPQPDLGSFISVPCGQVSAGTQVGIPLPQAITDIDVHGVADNVTYTPPYSPPYVEAGDLQDYRGGYCRLSVTAEFQQYAGGPWTRKWYLTNVIRVASYKLPNDAPDTLSLLRNEMGDFSGTTLSLLNGSGWAAVGCDINAQVDLHAAEAQTLNTDSHYVYSGNSSVLVARYLYQATAVSASDLQFRWQKLTTTGWVDVYVDGATLPASYTAEASSGDTWRVAARVAKGQKWYSNWIYHTFTITDNKPDCVITPSPQACTTEDLTATASGAFNADGTPVTNFDYRWQRYRSNQWQVVRTTNSVATDTVPAADTNVGDQWKVQARKAGGSESDWGDYCAAVEIVALPAPGVALDVLNGYQVAGYNNDRPYATPASTLRATLTTSIENPTYQCLWQKKKIVDGQVTWEDVSGGSQTEPGVFERSGLVAGETWRALGRITVSSETSPYATSVPPEVTVVTIPASPQVELKAKDGTPPLGQGAYANDDLLATVTSYPQGTATLHYTWYCDSAQVKTDDSGTSPAQSEIPAAETERDQTWRVEVVAVVSGVPSQPATASITILDHVPTLNLSIYSWNPGTLYQGAIYLAAIPLAELADDDGWDEIDEEQYSITGLTVTWKRTYNGQTTTETQSATSSDSPETYFWHEFMRYPIGPEPVGAVWTCQASANWKCITPGKEKTMTPVSASGSRTVQAMPSFTVGLAPATLNPGATTLTASASGMFPSWLAPTYTYKWYRNGGVIKTDTGQGASCSTTETLVANDTWRAGVLASVQNGYCSYTSGETFSPVRTVQALPDPEPSPDLDGLANKTGETDENSVSEKSDPVDAVTGEFYADGSFEVPGLYPIDLTWRYSSQCNNLVTLAGIGKAWRLTPHPLLYLDPVSNNPFLRLVTDSGATLTFYDADADGTFLPEARDNTNLAHNQGASAPLSPPASGKVVYNVTDQSYTWTMPSGETRVYAKATAPALIAGKVLLVTCTDLRDNTLDFYYEDAVWASAAFNSHTLDLGRPTGQLVRIANNSGRSVDLYYPTQGDQTIVDYVLDDAGRKADFAYTTYGGAPFLSGVTRSSPVRNPGGGVANPATTQAVAETIVDAAYTYSDAATPGTFRVATITKPGGQTLSNTYDDQGRVTLQEIAHTGEAGLVTSAAFAYDLNAGQTTVTQPRDGEDAHDVISVLKYATDTIHAEYPAGCVYQEDISIRGGVAVSTFYGWNARRQMTSRGDQDGTETVWEYETTTPYRLVKESRYGKFTGGDADAEDLVVTEYTYFQNEPLSVLDLPHVVTLKTATDTTVEDDAAVVRTTTFTYLNNGAMTERVVTDPATATVRGEQWAYYTPSELATLGLASTLSLVKSHTVYGPAGASSADAFTTEFAPRRYGSPLATDGQPAVVTRAPDSAAPHVTELAYYTDGQLAQSAVQLDAQTDLVTDLAYDGKGRPYAVRDPLGYIAYSEFDGRGNVTKTTGPRTGLTGLDQVTFQYDTLDGVLNFTRGTSTADGMDTVALARTYDRAGNLTSDRDRLTVTTTAAYDFRNRLTGSTLAARTGVTTDRELAQDRIYNDAARSIVAIDSLNGTDTATTTTRVTADASLPWREERPADAGKSCQAVAQYDPLGRLLAETDPDGNRVEYAYDALDRVVEARWIATSDGALTRYRAFEYNALGQVAFVFQDEALTRCTEYVYDAAGRVAEIIGPEVEPGSIQAHEELVYDGASRVTDRYVWRDATGADRARTHYTYLDNGQVATLTTPDDTTYWFEYDEAGLKTAELRALEPCGVADLASYNPNAANTHRTEFRYNVKGELVRKLVQAENGTLGSTLSPPAADPSRTYHVFSYAYDAAGQRTAVTDPAGRVWRLEYDNAGRVVEQSVSYGSPSTDLTYREFSYELSDLQDRPYCLTMTVRTDFPDSGHEVLTRYHYDGRGNLRVTEEAYGTAQQRVTETEVTGADQPATVTFGGVRSTFEYQFDQLAKSTHGTLNPLTFTRTYDSFGNLATAQTQSGGAPSSAPLLRFTHDANGALRSVTGSPLPHGATPSVHHYTYPGALSLRTVDADVYHAQADYGFSPEGRLAFAGAQLDGGQWQYPYVVDERDTAGRPTAVDRACGAAYNLYEWRDHEANGNLREDWLYTDAADWKQLLDARDTADYDALDRLANFEAELFNPASTTYTYSEPFGYLTGDGVATYDYDDFGNRQHRFIAGGATETYTYTVNGTPDPLQRLQSVTVSGVTTTYGYDTRGNLVERETPSSTTIYEWDDANRLTAAYPAAPTTGSVKVAFGYDALDRRTLRVRSTWNGTAWVEQSRIATVYDGGLPVAEFDAAGNLVREMVWSPEAEGGIGGLLLLRTAQGEFRPVYDYRGNVVAMFDATGALAERYTYDGFGRTHIFAPDDTELAESAIGNTFLFSTKLFDSDLGLYDFGARYYDPQAGRFISPDPLGFVDGPNPYLYVAGDPINWIDPWGLAAEGGLASAAWDVGTDFLAGAYMAWSNDNTLGANYALLQKLGQPLPEESGWATSAGAGFGHRVALGQGAAELVAGAFIGGAGATTAFGGAGASGTGAGALVGVPAMALGGAGVLKGIAIGGHGIGVGWTAGRNLANFRSPSKSGSDTPCPSVDRDPTGTAAEEGITANSEAGRARERYVQRKLEGHFKDASVQREQYLRTADGKIAEDPLTGEARRIDHVIIENGQARYSVETTSKTAPKAEQLAKEARIRANGGTFVRDRTTGELIDVSNAPTRVSRRK
ncbi:MAG: hypothetical protein A3K18_17770 [Lentisphaerae bacterium RIFOXYA12_64_32]|nr:MAG: hypothetical protein A3K18_17770 [Lentisphaerae bacterium RIFOXYA12_64_32]